MALRTEQIEIDGKTFTIKELSFGARVFAEDGKPIKGCIEPWDEFEKIMNNINRKDTKRIFDAYERVNSDDSPIVGTEE